MAATSNDRPVKFVHGIYNAVNVKAAEIIPNNVLVCSENGEAVNASDTAGLVFLGISTERVDNTDDGKKIQYRRGGECPLLNYAPGGATDALIGTVVCVKDNQTVDLAGNVTNDIPVGTIMRVESATQVFVDFDRV